MTGEEELRQKLGECALFAYFSAKEAVFKAMWPRHQRYVDFLEVALESNGDGSFRCHPGGGAPPDSRWRHLQVNWGANANFVFASAYFPN